MNLENFTAGASGDYPISRILPKTIFIKDYPENPSNFGEKLRKTRMDAGLKVKELARMLGVTEDTVINWEMRGISPRRWDFGKIEAVIDDMLSCRNQRAQRNFSKLGI